MLINVVCPYCKTSYQLQDDMRGKAMRCKQATCQKAFMIGGAPSAPAPAPVPATAPPPVRTQPAQSGSVGEVVPLLSAEAPPPTTNAAPSWLAGPPPRRSDVPVAKSPPEAKPAPAPKVAKPVKKQAEVEEADWTNAAAPPVRRGASKDKDKGRKSRPAHDPAPETVKIDHPILPTHTPRSRFVMWLIMIFAGLTIVVLSSGAVLLLVFIGGREVTLAQDAARIYDQGTFNTAATKYQQLKKNYKDSEKNPFYTFRAELAALRYAAHDGSEVPETLEEFSKFIKDREKDPLLGEHAEDIGQSITKMAEDFARRIGQEENPDGNENIGKIIEAMKRVFEQARAIRRPVGQPGTFDWTKAEDAIAKAEAAVALADNKRRTFGRLTQLSNKPSYQSLLEMENILSREREKFPELSDRADVKKLFVDLYNAHLGSIVYSPHKEKANKLPAVKEEREPALLLDPLLGGTPAQAGRGRNSPVALALARGVLYGLDRDTGRVRWALRVGIDTTSLPLRLRAGDGSGEQILALSSDTRTLTAIDSDGNPLWRYRMEQPCLGQPVIIENRAYLATRNGEVHEIELIQGQRLGTYSLGQTLTLGGTREPHTSRIYFPADDGCVYVLDVKARKCEAILYSRHPAGSLRNEVVLVNPEAEAGDDGAMARGYLILTQAVGLEAVELRVFDLPITNNLAEPIKLAIPLNLVPPPRLDGWTWFRPYADSEKLVMLSDAGALGMFGLRQTKNRDQALFGLLPGGGLRLDVLMAVQRSGRGRSDVVHMEGDDLWALTNDHLQRWRLAWDPGAGPRLISAWTQPQRVGSPLHAAQSFEDELGRMAMVVVTQPPKQPACWASCIDESSRLRWRRQLGVVCQTEPVPLAVEKEKPMLLVLDQSGALFAIDPQRYKVEGDWIFDAKMARLADPLDENPDQPPVVLPADGKTAYVVACPGDGHTLVVRTVTAGAKRNLEVSETQIKMPSALRGTPALVGSRLVMPLANGRVARLDVPLTKESVPIEAFDWRSVRAGPQSLGHITPLGEDRFLTTNGLRQLFAWDWPGGGLGKLAVLPRDRGNNPTYEMPETIITPPVLLPDGKGVAIADASGTLTLLEQTARGGLTEKRKWEKLGMISAGPFVEKVGDAVYLFVVSRSQLTCIDPNADKVLWTYNSEGEVDLTGKPYVGAGMVVTADQEGRYVALDLKTGKALSKQPYRLSGSIAPVAGVVGFHDDRLLAPLNDGTLLLLAVKHLKE